MRSKVLIAGISFLTLPLIHAEQKPCSDIPIEVNGQKLYEPCYCEQQSYPELVQTGKEIGVKVTASATAGSGGHYKCGVTYAWAEPKPNNLEECVKVKNEKVKKLESVQVLPV